MTTATPSTTPSGPVKLPRGRNVIENRIAARLGGHTTTPAWLDGAPFPELDELADDHRRLVAQLAANVDAVRDLSAEHAREDAEHRDALIAAARSGEAAPADPRTSAGDRDAARDAALDQAWATAQALAEVADAVIETARQHEDTWLDAINADAQDALAQEAEALRKLAQARAQRVRCGWRARWVIDTADDASALARAPFPTDDQHVPSGANPDALPLRRPWHRQRQEMTA
jgi:hypothetical protein